MLNREFLVKVVDHAVSASNWDQWTWISMGECGTTYCIAGFTVFDFSDEWSPVFKRRDCDCDECKLIPIRSTYIAINKNTQEMAGISRIAKDMLGLTEDQAARLFTAPTNKNIVLDITQDIINEHELTN